MSDLPMPTEPCGTGYHWEIVWTAYGGFWVCIVDPSPEEPYVPDPVPPPEPEDPAAWPWPLDILQSFIVGAFSWVGDVVTWGIGDLQYNLGTSLNNLGTDLTGVGDWLREQIESLITTTQGVIEERIIAVQTGTELAITTTQGLIEKQIKDTQVFVEDVGKGVTDLTEVALPAVQFAIGVQIAGVLQRVDTVAGGVEGIRQVIQDEVGPAIMGFINSTAGPILRQLNESLERI